MKCTDREELRFWEAAYCAALSGGSSRSSYHTSHNAALAADEAIEYRRARVPVSDPPARGPYR